MATTIDATILLPGITEEQMNTDIRTPEKDELVRVIGKGFKFGDGVKTLDELPYASGGGGVSLASDRVLYVDTTENAVENAIAFNEVYGSISSITPAPSKENPVTIIMGPGKYDFSSNNAYLGANYANISGLEKDTVFITGFFEFANTDNPYIKLSNLNGGNNFFQNEIRSNITFENCTAGDYSFGVSLDHGLTCAGTFINCKAGQVSFGEIFTGKAYNCTAGAGSFGAKSFRGELHYCHFSSAVGVIGSGAQDPNGSLYVTPEPSNGLINKCCITKTNFVIGDDMRIIDSYIENFNPIITSGSLHVERTTFENVNSGDSTIASSANLKFYNCNFNSVVVLKWNTFTGFVLFYGCRIKSMYPKASKRYSFINCLFEENDILSQTFLTANSTHYMSNTLVKVPDVLT